MPKPFPREFREDVVRVARNREHQVTIAQVAREFGVIESCLQNWLTVADREDGIKPGPTVGEMAELREAKKRIRLLEQENEVLRRAAAYLGQANLPGRLMYPLVRELAVDGRVDNASRNVLCSRGDYGHDHRYGIKHAEQIHIAVAELSDGPTNQRRLL